MEHLTGQLKPWKKNQDLFPQIIRRLLPILVYICVAVVPIQTLMERLSQVIMGGNVIFIIKEINDFSTRLTVNAFYSCIAKKYRYANAFSTEYIFESSYKVECESSGNFESALFQYLCLP